MEILLVAWRRFYFHDIISFCSVCEAVAGAEKDLTARQFLKAHTEKQTEVSVDYWTFGRPMASMQTDPSTKLTVLISGNGTNLQAVIDKVNGVISNRKNGYGLERAKRAGIPNLYHNLLQYKKTHPPTDQGM